MVVWAITEEPFREPYTYKRKSPHNDSPKPDMKIWRPRRDFKLNFIVTSGGRRLQFLRSTPTLDTLPETIHNDIYRRFVASQNPLRIDLDGNNAFLKACTK